MGLQEVISELNRVKAAGLITDYAIGGAIAASLYIEAASTVDVDVFVFFSGSDGLDALGPVWADLVAHGAKVEGPYLVIGGWPVQVLGPGSPLETEALRNARDHDFGGQTGRVLAPDYVAGIALATRRPKDFVRLAELMRRGKVDRTALMDLIDRFGLADSWKKFESNYLAD